ncbi:hypothetical protein KFE25_000859 [Diacronema lutheri]|uniref:Ubiquitin-like domain-containing protein n=2 Tax=Diacronema lutheri TaxID=2081491 RepID=A0A8J6CHA5_DIALT|nr:hypothetical protein KFE25_000859 [Diacronema lutheri]
MAASVGGTVDLIIKNPSLPDAEFRATVPLASSVLELKERLHRSHPCKPLVDEQKIIFAGKVLQDSEGLEGHMARHDTSVPITLHLVIRQASTWISQPTDVNSPAPLGAALPGPLPEPMAVDHDAGRPPQPPAGAQPGADASYPSYGTFRCIGYQHVVQYIHGQPYVFAVPALEPVWLVTPPGSQLPPGAFFAPWVAPPGAQPVLTPAPVGAQPWTHAQPHAPAGADASADAPHAAAASDAVGRPTGAEGDGERAAEHAAAPLAPPVAPVPADGDAAQGAQRDALQLALKLVLLVFMLGQDGDVDRLLLLCTIALAIFVAQTQNLAQLITSFRPPALLGGGAGGGPRPNAAADDDAAAAGGGAPREGAAAGGTARFCLACCVAFLSSLFPGYQLQPAQPEQPAQPQLAPAAPNAADGAHDGLYEPGGPQARAPHVPRAADMPAAEPAMRVDAREG